MVTVEAVEKELEKVVDPEIGLPITEMHLVDEINIQDNGDILIKYHLTAPFCPPIFAEDIGMNIRTLTSKLEGVKNVTVVLPMGFRLFWAGNMVRCEPSSNHAPEYSHGSSREGLSFLCQKPR